MPVVRDGALEYYSYINTDQFKKDIREMIQGVDRVGDKTEKETKRMDAAFRKLSTAVAGYFTFEAARQFLTQLVRIRGEFQQLNIALTTMLGSKEKADALMEQVKELAATTPFQLRDVAQGAKQLLAYGFSADTVAENLRKLGDLAAGVSAPLGDIVYLYGTMRTQGRAYAQDIRQFTNRGIPIIQKLADQFGVTAQEVNKLVSEGKVGFPQIEKAINSMTQEGGKFFNLMAKQSESLTGQISNLQDQFEFMLNDLGKSSEGFLYGAIGLASTLVENYEEIFKTLGTIIATYGTYRAAIIALTVAKRINHKITLLQAVSTKSLTAAQAASAIATNNLSKAWKALTASMATNPIGAAAIAISALVGGIIYLNSSVEDTNDIINDLNKSITELGDNTKGVDPLIESYETLSNKTEKTKEETAQLKTTVEKLADAFPGAISQIDSLGRTIDVNIDKVKDMNTALKEALSVVVESNLKKSNERLNVLKDQIDKYVQILSTGTVTQTVVGRTGVAVTNTIKASDGQIKEAKERIVSLRKEYKDLLKSIQGANDQLKGLGGSYTLYIPDSSPLDTDGNYQRAESLKTVAERIKELNTQLKEQQSILSKQRASGSTASAEDIKSTMDKISDIEGKLKVLRGKKAAAIDIEVPIKVTPIPELDAEKFGTTIKELLDKSDEEINREIAGWVPTITASAPNLKTAFEVLLEDPLNDTMESLKSKIEAIKQILKDGFFVDASGNKQIITPAQVQLLERVKRNLEGAAQTGSAMWDRMRELPSIFTDLGDSVGDLNSGLGQALNILGGIVTRAADFRNSIEEAKSGFSAFGKDGGIGNLIGGIAGGLGAIGAVVGVVTSITSAIKKHQQEIDRQRAKAIRRQNELIEKQIQLTNELYGVDKVKSYEQLLDQLNQARKEAAETILSTAEAYSDSPIGYVFQPILKEMKAAIESKDWQTFASLGETFASSFDQGKEQLKAYAETVGKSAENIKEIIRSINEEFTGTTSQSITNSIVDMFRNGKIAAQDFADSFEDIMKDAMIQTFKRKFIAQQIETWYQSFSKSLRAGDGKLTPKQIQDYREQLKGYLNNAKKGFENLEKVFGVDFSQEQAEEQKGLAGQIRRSITEDTATELSGRINGMYLMTKKSSDNVAALLTVQKNWQQKQTQQLSLSIRHLAGIESNTLKTANNSVYLSYLKSIDGKLSNSKDAKRAGGIK